MRNNFPCPIQYFFNKIPNRNYVSLTKIYKKVIILTKLNNAVINFLHSSFHSLCRVVNIRNRIVILEADNFYCLTQLRYEQYRLLFILKQNILPSLLSIKIVINSNLIQKNNIKK